MLYKIKLTVCKYIPLQQVLLKFTNYENNLNFYYQLACFERMRNAFFFGVMLICGPTTKLTTAS